MTTKAKTVPTTDDLLAKAGEISDAARIITGGYDINGLYRASCAVADVGEALKRLRVLLDQYDGMIMASPTTEL